MHCAQIRNVKNTARIRRSKSAFQRQLDSWVANALEELGKGTQFGLVSAQFVARLESLPDVRGLTVYYHIPNSPHSATQNMSST